MFNYATTTPLCFVLISLSVYFQNKYPEIFQDDTDKGFSMNFNGMSIFIVLGIFLLIILLPTINIAFTIYISGWTIYKTLKNTNKQN